MKIAVISAGVKLLPERFAAILASAGYDVKYYPPHAKLGYNYINWKTVDVLWNFGFFFGPDQLFDILKGKFKNLRIVNVWVGTDILNLANYLKARPKCRDCMLKSIDVHVVDYVDFIKELKNGLGIKKSWFVPAIPDPMPLTPLPEEFAVGCYTPPHRKAFYGFGEIIQVAKQLPDVPFYVFPSLIVGWGKSTPPLPNVHLMPLVQGDEKFEWWAKISANITIPIHGGISLAMIEFLQMGRRAVTNKKLPYVYYVEEPVKPDNIVEKLKEIMKFKEPDEEASKYYHEEYSPKKVIKHVKPIIETLQND